MLNRRHFILSIPVLATIPFVKLEPGFQRPKSAEKYLTKLFNEASKGTGFKHCPKFIYSGRSLHEQFEAELLPIQRYISKYTDNGWCVQFPDEKCLAFKATKYKWSTKLKPYEVVMSRDEIIDL